MIILIDFENVNLNGIAGIKKLGAQDSVYFFFNNKSKIDFNTHIVLEKLECEKVYQLVSGNTKNALDFLLVERLGELVVNDNEAEYFIISNDGGFDAVVKHLRAKNISVARKKSIADALNKNEAPVKEELNETAEDEGTTLDKVNKLFDEAKSSINSDNRKLIAKYIDKYKTKAGFNNALQKVFSNQKVKEINKTVKPLMKDKKGI